MKSSEIKGGQKMDRYEWKQISRNWFGLWDSVKREFVIETTAFGMEAYKKLGI